MPEWLEVSADAKAAIARIAVPHNAAFVHHDNMIDPFRRQAPLLLLKRPSADGV
jgi:predicted nucleic acid-binding protein